MALVLFGLGTLGWCAATVTGSRQPAPLLESVPDVEQQTDYSCGPSALVAVLAYYGFAEKEHDIIREARTDPEVGAEVEYLAEVAQHRGLEAIPCIGLRMADLEREIQAGHPVIILNQTRYADSPVPWCDEWENGHYLVVIGIDARFVYVEDPVLVGRRGKIPRREFEARWHGPDINQKPAFGQGLIVRGTPAPQASRVRLPFERIK
jgi:predicted double-glycine peptidase